MLLGAADFYVGDWRGLPADVVERAAGLGFGTLNLRIADPADATADDIHRTRQLFADHGLVVGQTVGSTAATWSAPTTSRRRGDHRLHGADVRPDEPPRVAQHLPSTRQPEPGRRLDAPPREPVGCGLRSAGRQHAAHLPDGRVGRASRSPSRRASCRRCTRPARVKEFIDAVGSPALGFNQDPVNLVGTLEDAWDTTRLVNECFDVLGAHTIGAHAKDVRIVDGLFPGFEEAEIGVGAHRTT